MLFERTTSRFRNAAFAAVLAVLSGGAAGCASSPRLQDLNAVGLHTRAQTAFDRGDHGQAIEALDRLILFFPEYPQLPEARFLLARAYEADEQYLLASDEYVRFMERHPL